MNRPTSPAPAWLTCALLTAFLVAPLIFANTASAQDAEDAAADSTAGQWEQSLTAKLSGSQARFRNWQGGGVDTYAISGGLRGSAQREDHRFLQTHEIRLALGGIQQEGTTLRKAEDLLLLTTTWRYRGGGFFSAWRPTLSARLRTQFAPGFVFEEGNVPASLQGADVPTKTSDFFAPAELTQTLGLTREFTPYLKQRFGFAGKETVVTIRRLRPVFGNGLDETVRYEVGAESVTEFDKEVAKNVRYTSTLGLFLAFNNPNPPDLLWENSVAMKVNDWLGANFEFATLYDRDVTDAIQIRQSLSVGLTFLLI